jgi:hypothetical protein
MAVADQPSIRAAGPLMGAVPRGTPGFFRVARDLTGRWWLHDPTGALFFAKCVHGVRPAGGEGDGALPLDSAARLRAWGFNAVGAGEGTVGPEDGLPFLAAAEFCASGPVVAGPGLRLPDVFDPDWPQRAMQHAQAVCRAHAENAAVLGWVTDTRLAWAQPSLAGRPSLLQLCLSLEPNCAAYHAAWEFVLALHGGRLDRVAAAWGTTMANKEVVRELTRAEEGLGTRGYLRDELRWTREFARRYFTGAAAALRSVDPNHLIFGPTFQGGVGAAVLGECAYPAVDVAMPDWRELPTVAETGAPHPVLAGNVCWNSPDFTKLPTAARMLRLTSVEWMLRRGRSALERTARHPAVVGYAWGRWQDEPGEVPPFARGLVHQNGIEAREHTELLGYFNARAESLHGTGSELPPAAPG